MGWSSKYKTLDSGTLSSAVLKMGIPSFSRRIHTASIGEDSSILGTFREKPAPFCKKQNAAKEFHQFPENLQNLTMMAVWFLQYIKQNSKEVWNHKFKLDCIPPNLTFIVDTKKCWLLYIIPLSNTKKCWLCWKINIYLLSKYDYFGLFWVSTFVFRG